MPNFSSHPVIGTLTDVNAVVVNGAYIWIYNKTKDEMHSGWDSGFTQLVTNSSGEYSGNLGSFTGGWDDADEIFVSVEYQGYKQYGRVVVDDGLSSETVNMQLADMHPLTAYTNYLRTRVDDPNSSRTDGQNSQKMIYEDWPRTNLGINSYPRITTRLESESIESMGASQDNTNSEHLVNIIVTIHIWKKTGREQILTVSSIAYEGKSLANWLSRQVSDANRRGFLKTKSKDGLINDFYAWMQGDMKDLDFDEEEGIMRMEIPVMFNYVRQI